MKAFNILVVLMLYVRVDGETIQGVKDVDLINQETQSVESSLQFIPDPVPLPPKYLDLVNEDLIQPELNTTEYGRQFECLIRLNLYIAYDQSFKKMFAEEGPSNVINKIVELSQRRYFQRPELNPNLHLNVLKIEEIKDNDHFYAEDGPSYPIYNKAQKFARTIDVDANIYTIFTTDDANKLSKSAGLGTLPLGSVCDKTDKGKRITITEYHYDVGSTAWIYGHEIGHALNMEDDYLNGAACFKDESAIMHKHARDHWSTCSLDSYRAYDINKRQSPINCLFEQTPCIDDKSESFKRYVQACESQRVTLDCQNRDGFVIHILASSYGRPTYTTDDFCVPSRFCRNSPSSCTCPKTSYVKFTDYLIKECEKKSQCIIEITNKSNGFDPCVGVTKFAKVWYICYR